jgi:hypothetical protein
MGKLVSPTVIEESDTAGLGSIFKMAMKPNSFYHHIIAKLEYC